MTRRDVVLALVVAVLWGLAFVASRLGLDTYSPPTLAALRFGIAALPCVVLRRPRIPVRLLVATGLTLFAGQFLFQFFGIAAGTPPGLAAVVVQTQAFFTILFAALLLGERPAARQVAGMACALAGLLVIATSIGPDLTATGLALTLVSPVSFGIGNLFLKRLDSVAMLSLVAWLSLVPPVPALALAALLDGPRAVLTALVQGSWVGLTSAVYLGLVATLLAYAIWGGLLGRYPAATVTPFALLVPLVAAVASSVVFGERFGSVRLAGMALVLSGVALSVLPPAVVRSLHRQTFAWKRM